jgi:carboxymethylenebutenolidase
MRVNTTTSYTLDEVREGNVTMTSIGQDAIRAETVMITGNGGDEIEAYRAIPLADGSRGGVVWIHHMPGYDRETKEFVRRLAVAGYNTICPNLYWREAPGAEPDDAAAAARAAGGVPDDRLVGDVAGAAEYLRGLAGANGKIGVIGHCSGGRQTVLAACTLKIDAAVDCYGAFVVEDPPDGMPKHMKPILDRVPTLSCPLLGLFGKDDVYPSPEAVARLDAELARLGRDHEFHSYDGAGHSFFSVDRPAYRVEAAVDGWRRIHDFFARHLAG